jgi:hypothetical protein
MPLLALSLKGPFQFGVSGLAFTFLAGWVHPPHPRPNTCSA